MDDLVLDPETAELLAQGVASDPSGTYVSRYTREVRLRMRNGGGRVGRGATGGPTLGGAPSAAAGTLRNPDQVAARASQLAAVLRDAGIDDALTASLLGALGNQVDLFGFGGFGGNLGSRTAGLNMDFDHLGDGGFSGDSLGLVSQDGRPPYDPLNQKPPGTEWLKEARDRSQRHNDLTRHDNPRERLPDAGMDGGHDGGTDAGHDAGVDTGTDAGTDAGQDAGADAGGYQDLTSEFPGYDRVIGASGTSIVYAEEDGVGTFLYRDGEEVDGAWNAIPPDEMSALLRAATAYHEEHDAPPDDDAPKKDSWDPDSEGADYGWAARTVCPGGSRGRSQVPRELGQAGGRESILQGEVPLSVLLL